MLGFKCGHMQVLVTVCMCSTPHTTGPLLACKHTECMMQDTSNKPLLFVSRVCCCCHAPCTWCVCKLTAICIMHTVDLLLPENQQAMWLSIPTTVWVALLPAARVTASLTCRIACSYAIMASDHSLLTCNVNQDATCCSQTSLNLS